MIYFKGEVARAIFPSPLNFNISGFSTLSINFFKPDGTTVTKTATAVDNNTGQVKYVTTASDTVLDKVGEWFMQVKVNTSTTAVRYGPIENFYVEDRIV